MSQQGSLRQRAPSRAGTVSRPGSSLSHHSTTSASASSATAIVSGNTRSRAAISSRQSRLPPAVTVSTAITGRQVEEVDFEKEPIKVYLRLRPPPIVQQPSIQPSFLSSSGLTQVVLEDEFSTASSAHRYLFNGVFDPLPTSAAARMASADGDVPVESDGFSSSASQEAVFEATTLPLVRDLILGMRDGLLFAYGITSSGKSHSIQGTPSQPGLLPRTLKLITSWLNDKDGSRHSQQRVMIHGARSVVYCDKDKLHAPVLRRIGSDVYNMESVTLDMLSTDGDDNTNDIDNGEHEYAVMVSYTEVYNDRVYDLLDIEQLATQANSSNNNSNNTNSASIMGSQSSSQSGSMIGSMIGTGSFISGGGGGGNGSGILSRGRGQNLLAPSAVARGLVTIPGISTGSGMNGNNAGNSNAMITANERIVRVRGGVNNEDHYLEGVTEVRVRTIDEAMAVFESGQRNRAVYSTQLNSDSSRSHALFNIKLIRLHKDAILEPGKQIKSSYEQNASCRISQLTLVDLAGSERPDKTQASGNRLREAGKINQSLLDLGSVLQALRDNQYESDKRKHKLIPFRNSELTKLFKSPLTGGKAGVVMLVTVNPYDSSRNETRKVLDFSAVASSVFTIVNKPQPDAISNDENEPPSTLGSIGGMTAAAKAAAALVPPLVPVNVKRRHFQQHIDAYNATTATATARSASSSIVITRQIQNQRTHPSASSSSSSSTLGNNSRRNPSINASNISTSNGVASSILERRRASSKRSVFGHRPSVRKPSTSAASSSRGTIIERHRVSRVSNMPPPAAPEAPKVRPSSFRPRKKARPTLEPENEIDQIPEPMSIIQSSIVVDDEPASIAEQPPQSLTMDAPPAGTCTPESVSASAPSLDTQPEPEQVSESASDPTTEIPSSEPKQSSAVAMTESNLGPSQTSAVDKPAATESDDEDCGEFSTPNTVLLGGPSTASVIKDTAMSNDAPPPAMSIVIPSMASLSLNQQQQQQQQQQQLAPGETHYERFFGRMPGTPPPIPAGQPPPSPIMMSPFAAAAATVSSRNVIKLSRPQHGSRPIPLMDGLEKVLPAELIQQHSPKVAAPSMSSSASVQKPQIKFDFVSPRINSDSGTVSAAEAMAALSLADSNRRATATTAMPNGGARRKTVRQTILMPTSATSMIGRRESAIITAARASISGNVNRESEDAGEASFFNDSDSTSGETVRALFAYIDQLKTMCYGLQDTIRTERVNSFEREQLLREEMAREFQEQLKSVELIYQERLRQEQEMQDGLIERKIDILTAAQNEENMLQAKLKQQQSIDENDSDDVFAPSPKDKKKQQQQQQAESNEYALKNRIAQLEAQVLALENDLRRAAGLRETAETHKIAMAEQYELQIEQLNDTLQTERDQHADIEQQLRAEIERLQSQVAQNENDDSISDSSSVDVSVDCEPQSTNDYDDDDNDDGDDDDDGSESATSPQPQIQTKSSEMMTRGKKRRSEMMYMDDSDYEDEDEDEYGGNDDASVDEGQSPVVAHSRNIRLTNFDMTMSPIPPNSQQQNYHNQPMEVISSTPAWQRREIHVPVLSSSTPLNSQPTQSAHQEQRFVFGGTPQQQQLIIPSRVSVVSYTADDDDDDPSIEIMGSSHRRISRPAMMNSISSRPLPYVGYGSPSLTRGYGNSSVSITQPTPSSDGNGTVRSNSSNTSTRSVLSNMASSAKRMVTSALRSASRTLASAKPTPTHTPAPPPAWNAARQPVSPLFNTPDDVAEKATAGLVVISDKESGTGDDDDDGEAYEPTPHQPSALDNEIDTGTVRRTAQKTDGGGKKRLLPKRKGNLDIDYNGDTADGGVHTPIAGRLRTRK